MKRFKKGDKVIITGDGIACDSCNYSSCKECVNKYDNEDNILTVRYDEGGERVSCTFPKMKGKSIYCSSQCLINRKDLTLWGEKIKWQDFLKQ